MSLKERAREDRHRVFMQTDHFAEEHTWNGITFICVTDDEAVLKRKNNNVNDISWNFNSDETLVYVPAEDWPGRRVTNERGFFDNRYMTILEIQDDMDMLSIRLGTVSPKAVGGGDGYDDEDA